MRIGNPLETIGNPSQPCPRSKRRRDSFFTDRINSPPGGVIEHVQMLGLRRHGKPSPAGAGPTSFTVSD